MRDMWQEAPDLLPPAPEPPSAGDPCLSASLSVVSPSHAFLP